MRPREDSEAKRARRRHAHSSGRVARARRCRRVRPRRATSVQRTNEESLCASLLKSLTASQSCGATSAGQGGAVPGAPAVLLERVVPRHVQHVLPRDVERGGGPLHVQRCSRCSSGRAHCGGTLGPQPATQSCVTLAMCLQRAEVARRTQLTSVPGDRRRWNEGGNSPQRGRNVLRRKLAYQPRASGTAPPTLIPA